ncbi:hypothetical protein SAMN05444398_101858 [Roseovarius pacificus]|uniref:Uncharacterized protein n=1 Tax=Roseovarius pacificus TaxID=337701 RepID=A0A1M6YHC1_9RHOB|nr:hypothetical protein [Roseovarius pacificus]SHL17520.1 hypothetical protein SAMN05444398_101858 [Roseovarius pacificus]
MWIAALIVAIIFYYVLAIFTKQWGKQFIVAAVLGLIVAAFRYSSHLDMSQSIGFAPASPKHFRSPNCLCKSDLRRNRHVSDEKNES